MSKRDDGLLSGRTRAVVGALGLATAGVVAAAVVHGGGGVVKVEIPAGTRLVAALDRTVSTRHVKAGEPVELHTIRPLELSDGVSIPEGVVVQGEVTHARGGGRIAGAPELTIRFTRLEIEDRPYPISADPFRVRGKDDLRESAALIGGGAVVGGVVGALAGNTKAGVAAGAVIGTGTAVVTKGDQIVLPAGQKLRVRLAEPVTVRFKRDRDRES